MTTESTADKALDTGTPTEEAGNTVATAGGKRSEDTADRPISRQARQFTVLSTDHLSEQPTEMRRAIYDEVLKRVNGAVIPGLVHAGNYIEITMTHPAGNVRGRRLEDILLKNTPEVQAQVEDAIDEVVRQMVVRNRARGISVGDLEEMGEQLDFDALVLAAKQHRENSLASAAKGHQKRVKAKTKR